MQEEIHMVENSMISTIVNIVKSCTPIMLEAKDISDNVEAKEGHGNFVTAFDKRMQAALEEKLAAAFPDAQFLGEEDESRTAADLYHGMVFVIDPIDGTSNFMNGLNYSCVSVGVVIDGKRYAGVVYNPYNDECFTAERGQGAYLNDKQIHVSNTDLAHSLVLFGTAPYYEELWDRTFELARDYCSRGMDLRRSGSAALDLCNIACGRAGLFFELRLQPWDFTAGIVLIEEAGGLVVDENGRELPLFEASSIWACNSKIGE